MTDVSDGFGFKRLTLQNWQTPDPVWRHFAHPPFLDPADAWVQDILKNELAESVPIAVRRLFEVARGTLVYGFFFYPLLTVGTEQIFRVADAATTIKCKSMTAPRAKTKPFETRLEWLRDNNAFAESEYPRWDALREMRNTASHPCDQHILSPTPALQMLEATAELINRLFDRHSANG
ncbi:MAG TPA: hypothetical protein VMF12_18085 [Xanthobacteraceae bacterium]|nr:hypothetical protein [Xanthobacteraceae bacterium]